MHTNLRETAMPLMFRFLDGSGPDVLIAESAVDLVARMRAASPYPELSDRAFMRAVADRALVAHAAYVHTHSAEAFVADLEWLGLVKREHLQ